MNRKMQSRLARGQTGSALVEFALTAWLLIFLLAAVVQWTVAMYAYHYTAYAAQQGARYAMVRGYTWSENVATPCSTSGPYTCTASATDIQNYVQSLGGLNARNLTMNTTASYVWPGKTPDGTSTGCAQSNSKGCLVKVTVNYTFNFLPLMPMTAMTISSTSEQVILQ